MRCFFTVLFAVLCAVAQAAQPRFTYDDLAAGKFTQKSVSGLRPMADGHHYSVREGQRIVSYGYRDGKQAEVLFNGEIVFSDYELSGDEKKILLATNPKPIYRHSFSADYVVYDRATGTLTPLTKEGGEQQAMFSPDGGKVGFVRENDLYVVDLNDFLLRRITTDGQRNKIINGLPDWVYEEEFAFSRAFCFAPDSRRIAWMRFDESAVREYTMMRFEGNLYPQPYTYKYPKAGEANSVVDLWTYDLQAGRAERVQALDLTTHDYIPRIGYTPDGELWFFSLNRAQNHLQVVVGDEIAYEDADDHYVERPDDQTVTFLAGHRMVVMSESSGYRHLYLCEKRKERWQYIHPITSGDWDVEDVVAVEGNRVWYTSAEGSPLRRNLYSVGLDGKNKRRLTTGEGHYRIQPGKGMRYYISYFSNVSTPLQVSVHSGEGALVRVLEDNVALSRRIDSLHLPRKEFFILPAADGTPLNAYVVKPEGFDPQKKYPVLMTQYSGPGSQQVLDRWSMDWEDVVVQYGYVVVCVDGRGTGMRGESFRKLTYGQLGKYETEDQIAAARWLAGQPWVDGARIGIYGWSYGGFMSLNCILKGADVFRMAIAVAPVTSWRFYDTIYTEIYNGLPQENATGYDDNSPINYADRLKGKLLMIHGSGDDNVHVQNTYEMARALVRAGKQFDMMVYPDDNHSMVPSGRANVRQKMVEYVLTNL